MAHISKNLLIQRLYSWTECTRKLLIFTDTESEQINGVQLSINNLRANLEKNIEIQVISPEDFLHFPLPRYQEIHLSVVFPRQIRKIIHKYKPDYVHIATEGPIGFVAATVCKSLNIPYTSAFHTKFPEYIELRNKYIPSSYVHTFLKHIHNGSEKIFISNDPMRKYLEENNYGRTHVIPFGIDHSVFYPDEKSCFQNLPKPVLLFVGRVAIEKNIEDFLRIQTPGSKVVVGDGPLRESLEAKYPEAIFLGYKSKHELADIYRSADLFVLPSKTDTLGLVNLEAMACGLPVLAYDVDGPRGIVQPEKTWVLIPETGDLAGWVDTALGIRSDACIESVKEYTWTRYAEKFIENQFHIPRSTWI